MPLTDAVARFSNVWNVNAGPQVMRLTFGEAVGTERAPAHSAIVMLVEDAEQMARGILDAASKVRAQSSILRPVVVPGTLIKN